MYANVLLKGNDWPSDQSWLPPAVGSAALSELAGALQSTLKTTQDGRPPSEVSQRSIIAEPRWEDSDQHLEVLTRKARRARRRMLSEVRFRPPLTIERRVTDALAAMKVSVARVSGYLDSEWRLGLLRQLDFLMDADEWPEEVAPPSQVSFGSFLMFCAYYKPHKRPALGVSNNGDFIATWSDSDARLFVEFGGPGRSLVWSASQVVGPRREAVSGQVEIERLSSHLAAFGPERWFSRFV